MKNIAVLLLLINISLSAQNYLPWNEGDTLLYQYDNFSFVNGRDSGWTHTYKRFVVSAVYFEGIKYLKIFDTFNGFPPYENRYYDYRIDEKKLYTYSYSSRKLAVDFNTLPGGIFTGALRGTPEFWKRYSYTWGFYIKADTMIGGTNRNEITAIFNQTFGLKYYHHFNTVQGNGTGTGFELIEAKTPSQLFTFGWPQPYVLGLTPVRKITDFPFNLQVAHWHPYPELMDSLIILVEVYRGIYPVISRKYSFDHNTRYVPVNLYPSELKVNDFVRISFKLSDTSLSKRTVLVPPTDYFGLQVTQATGVDDNNDDMLSGCQLHQNYPNPFNPSTVIMYTVHAEALVKLAVYDVLGNEIVTLVNEHKPAGSYEVNFDGSNLNSGVYFYRLTSGNYSAAKRMLLVK